MRQSDVSCAFFYGLSGEGLDTTIQEYTNSGFWRVHTVGYDADQGFWVVFEAVE